MSLKIKKGIVYNENETMIAVMTEYSTHEDEQEIELGSEIIPVVKQFVKDVNDGSLKPKTSVDKFQAVLSKYQ